MDAPDAADAPPRRPWTRVSRPVLRALPPARLVWILLAAIGAYGVTQLPRGLGVASLLVLPVVAVGVDLVFQIVRFPRLRFPDAAIATGLFLALLLPPTVLLAEAGIVALAAIAVRHVARYRGRPWFNPAATGVLLGAVFFGMAPGWWVSIGTVGEVLMLSLGIVLALRTRATWRLPVTFLLAYAGLSAVYHVLFGGATSAGVLVLSVLDPATLFFALFMVPEPRSAPSDPALQPIYAALIAVVGVFSPLLFPTLGLLVALALGNVTALGLRRAARRTSAATPSGRGRPDRHRRAAAPARSAAAARWGVGRRVAAGFLLVVVLGVAAAVTAPTNPSTTLVSSSGATPTPVGGGAVTAAGCTSDNPSIPSGTLQSLHSALGPSVILSYNSNTGVVVFYDPVHHVTVTETDMFEDYGFAEFNGDDYAVNGCSP